MAQWAVIVGCAVPGMVVTLTFNDAQDDAGATILARCEGNECKAVYDQAAAPANDEQDFAIATVAHTQGSASCRTSSVAKVNGAARR